MMYYRIPDCTNFGGNVNVGLAEERNPSNRV